MNKPTRERDIVERLRLFGVARPNLGLPICDEAAAEITRLRELLEAPSPQPDTDVVERVAHYYVSGVVVTTAHPAYFQVMEEADGKQECIATVPFHKAINPAAKGGRDGARKDADMIVRALNATAALNASTPEIQTQDLGGISGSSSLRSPEPVPVSAHSGDDPGRDALHEALEPFALLLGEDDEDFPDSEPVIVRFGRSTDYSLTLADIRRAATVAHTYFTQSTRDGSGNRSADNPLPLNE